MVPDDPERFLCPVRQLLLYKHDSKATRGGRRRLFLHWDPLQRDVKTSHISKWLIDTVRIAYEGTPEADLGTAQVTAHEVRALSASWAYDNSVSLDEIKTALYWKSDGIFQKHYLRDLSSDREELARYGQLVVAGTVVRPIRRQ